MACLWGSEQLHLEACHGFLKVGLANALEGTQDAEIVREAASFWYLENMRQRREEVVHDVDVEVRAERLQWRFSDVYQVVNPFPEHGKSVDVEPMDKGSDSDDDHHDGGAESDAASDGMDDVAMAEAESDGRVNAIAHVEGDGEVLAVQSSVPLEADNVAQDTQATLRGMHVVLEQIRAMGSLSLEAQVLRAIGLAQRKLRMLCREHPVVTESFMGQQDAERREAHRQQLSLHKTFHKDKERNLAIKQLSKEQDKLGIKNALPSSSSRRHKTKCESDGRSSCVHPRLWSVSKH